MWSRWREIFYKLLRGGFGVRLQRTPSRLSFSRKRSRGKDNTHKTWTLGWASLCTFYKIFEKNICELCEYLDSKKLSRCRVFKNKKKILEKISVELDVTNSLQEEFPFAFERANVSWNHFPLEVRVVGAPAAYGSSVGVVTHGFPGSSSCERFSSRKHTLITSQLKDSSSTRMRGLVVGWTASEPRAGPEPVLVCHMTGTGPDSRFRWCILAFR